MTEQPDLETRVTGLEQRMRAVEADAAAARKLSADTDRDVGEFAIKLDANRRAINALGEQTAAGLAELRSELSGTRAEMRAGFDAIGRQLDRLIERKEDS